MMKCFLSGDRRREYVNSVNFALKSKSDELKRAVDHDKVPDHIIDLLSETMFKVTTTFFNKYATKQPSSADGRFEMNGLFTKRASQRSIVS